MRSNHCLRNSLIWSSQIVSLQACLLMTVRPWQVRGRPALMFAEWKSLLFRPVGRVRRRPTTPRAAVIQSASSGQLWSVKVAGPVVTRWALHAANCHVQPALCRLSCTPHSFPAAWTRWLPPAVMTTCVIWLVPCHCLFFEDRPCFRL